MTSVRAAELSSEKKRKISVQKANVKNEQKAKETYHKEDLIETKSMIEKMVDDKEE